MLWFEFNVRNNGANIFEVACAKKKNKVDNLNGKFAAAIEKRVQMIEHKSFMNSLFEIFNSFYKGKYPKNKHQTNDVEEYLKALRLMYMISCGNVRKMPMFMMKIEE